MPRPPKDETREEFLIRRRKAIKRRAKALGLTLDVEVALEEGGGAPVDELPDDAG